MKDIRILLVGIGGFGENYVRELLNTNKSGVKLAGAVDPFPDRCKQISALRERGIPIFSTLEDFYKENCADLAVICTPIHLHLDHTIYCLSKGSNVLCEKPLCSVYQDALKMLEAEKKYGKFVAIAYQLSYSDAIQELKRDIISGSFGKAKRLKSLLIFPRHESYYKRSSWSGRLKTESGRWVLDSPIMNSCAHQLHNMLYILGSTRETSTYPISVKAELYRVNPLVENYDTAALRIFTEDNVEILMYSTQAMDGEKSNKVGPYWEFEFEKAVLYHKGTFDEDFYALFNDGRIKNYGEMPRSSPFKKLWDVIDIISSGGKAACGIEAAIPHVICINGAQESMKVVNFPEYLIENREAGGELRTYVKGIENILLNCFKESKLPFEIGYSFAREAKAVDLKDYTEFEEARTK